MHLKLLLPVLCILSSFPLSGTDDAAIIYRDAEKKEVGTYFDLNHRAVEEREYRLFLRFNFGSATLRNPEMTDEISDQVRQINLYYTDFPKGTDLSALNQQRIAALLEYRPELANAEIRWVVYRQTNCPSLESAINLFHGFEIIQDFSDEIDLTDVEIDSSFQDFVVDRVLDRNDWTDMLVVTDLTGSMDPYIAQLFLWLRLQTNDGRVRQFVFFNDGDSELDDYKVIGATGGLYAIRAGDIMKVELTAIRCMRSGYGGDVPENDVEALLYGLDECSDCGEVVLIADNQSDMRDVELIRRLQRPVRVILCGAEGKALNAQYLNLARETGGSVHLMEQDLLDLMEMKEGETLELFGKTYRIIDNRFVLEKST